MLTFILSACTENKGKEPVIESVNTQVLKKEGSLEKVERIRTIFYSLPSPLELNKLFMSEGVKYHPEKLHSTSMRKHYHTEIKKALNIGVYGADLSYSALSGKHQPAIEFFAATQILAEELGIGRTFQRRFISRLESNADDKDTLIQVVTEFFLENDSYLKNHDQQDISTYILTGGWIEGLYLGTQMTDEDTNIDGIKKVIVNQKNSLHNIIILLQNLNKSDGVDALVKDIGELDVYYKEIWNSKEIPDSTYLNITNKVASIRNNFIK